MSPTWRFLLTGILSRVVCVMAGAFGEIAGGTRDLDSG
jgi:hypothetical protein